MEEKKQIKISLKTAVILSIIGIIVLVGLVYFAIFRTKRVTNIEYYKGKYYITTDHSSYNEKPFLENKDWRIINSYAEYLNLCIKIDKHLINQTDNWYEFSNYASYKKSYTEAEDSLDFKKMDRMMKRLNEEMENIKEEYKIQYDRRYTNWYESIPEEKFNSEFFETHNLLLIDIYKIHAVLHRADLTSFSVNDNTAKISFCTEYGGLVSGGNGIIHYIVLDKNVNNVKLDISSKNTSTPGDAYKPIIYLYPTKELEVTVTLGKPENLTHTYPKYENSWNVLAKPNGDLIDLKTGRSQYSLYWEGINIINPNLTEGFVVEGKDTASFLEEKLAILGLTEREANEFIIYWLPKLESNIYNFIRFQTIEEINANMPLKIAPTPDTIIRVMMEFKPLNKIKNTTEQNLETPTRDGFVIVEWGGIEII